MISVSKKRNCTQSLNCASCGRSITNWFTPVGLHVTPVRGIRVTPQRIKPLGEK